MKRIFSIIDYFMFCLCSLFVLTLIFSIIINRGNLTKLYQPYVESWYVPSTKFVKYTSFTFLTVFLKRFLCSIFTMQLLKNYISLRILASCFFYHLSRWFSAFGLSNLLHNHNKMVTTINLDGFQVLGKSIFMLQIVFTFVEFHWNCDFFTH